MELTVASSFSMTELSRSWVSGRGTATPWSFTAMASASAGPIQMGRYRSESFSFKITTRW